MLESAPKLGTAKSQGGLFTVMPDSQVDTGHGGTPEGLRKLKCLVMNSFPTLPSDECWHSL